MTKKAITIDRYTSTWDAAMRPTAPRKGTMVRTIPNREPDGREWDGFRRVLKGAGLDLAYSHATTRGIYRLVVVAPTSQMPVSGA